MKKLAIIHFNPVELYPPALNWLDLLAGEAGDKVAIDVCTMHPPPGFGRYRPATPRLKITRAGRLGTTSPLSRYCQYLGFYLAATFLLIRRRPGAVIYYETLSAFPVWFYKRFINRGARIFIHYHEYTSPAEYRDGMWLNRWQHRLEQRLYPSAVWLSQTNADRAGLFRKDQAGIVLPEIKLLPNYPPAAWLGASSGQNRPAAPLKLVYVGALSLETMYTREVANWIDRQEGNVTLDIYTGNISPDARAWLEDGRHPAISIHPPVDYFQLPQVLKQYQVGLILYNGHIPNYVYNAPNKLFEYWACGLDVWLPDVLVTSGQYVNKDRFPRILSFDFTRLEDLSWREAIDHTGLGWQPSPYNAEAALQPLKIEMLAD